MRQITIRDLGPSDAAAVTHVLCDAFHDYPVMRHVLGAVPEYEMRLERLVGLFVMARVFRNEALFGVGDPGGILDAAALVSYPGAGVPSPAEFRRLRVDAFAELGADVLQRYEAYGEATEAFAIEEPHIHLNMIGVRRDLKGKGLGRKLLERVHRHSLERPHSSGVTLTTEDPANVAFYERMGYECVGHVRVAPGLETWGFFRPDRG